MQIQIQIPMQIKIQPLCLLQRGKIRHVDTVQRKPQTIHKSQVIEIHNQAACFLKAWIVEIKFCVSHINVDRRRLRQSLRKMWFLKETQIMIKMHTPFNVTLEYVVSCLDLDPHSTDNCCEAECDIRKNFDTNEYPNIFVSKNLHEWMSEYIRIKNLTRTNVRINICIENCMNIRIYSNIRPVFTL